MRISDWSSDVCSSDLIRTCEWRHQKPLSHHLATFPTFPRPAEICGFFDFSQSGRGGKPKIRQKSRQILGELKLWSRRWSPAAGVTLRHSKGDTASLLFGGFVADTHCGCAVAEKSRSHHVEEVISRTWKCSLRVH